MNVKCIYCYNIIQDHSNNDVIDKKLCSDCYTKLKDKKCESCDKLLMTILKKNIPIPCQRSSYGCKNKVCDSCPKTKIFGLDNNRKLSINFIQLCKECRSKLEEYDCEICNSHIDDYYGPITCDLCEKKICTNCSNIIECSCGRLFYHRICNDCNTICENKYNNKKCDECCYRHHTYHRRHFRSGKTDKLNSDYKRMNDYKYCRTCYSVMCIFNSKQCNYCKGNYKKTHIISKCQSCRQDNLLIDMHSTQKACYCCAQVLTIQLCQTHRDCKSVIKWKCCSQCNKYYCKRCRDNVQKCKKCNKIFCKDHTDSIKNSICKRCDDLIQYYNKYDMKI